MADRLTPGVLVRVHGLQSKPELNQALGIIGPEDTWPTSGRIAIHIPMLIKPVALKRSSLMVVDWKPVDVTMTQQFIAGAIVQISGLTRKPKLNGAIGFVCPRDPWQVSGRIAVQVPGSANALAIKQSNLILVKAAEIDSALESSIIDCVTHHRSLRLHHLHILRHIGQMCSRLPDSIKARVYKCLREPDLLYANGDLTRVSMQTGQKMKIMNVGLPATKEDWGFQLIATKGPGYINDHGTVYAIDPDRDLAPIIEHRDTGFCVTCPGTALGNLWWTRTPGEPVTLSRMTVAPMASKHVVLQQIGSITHALAGVVAMSSNNEFAVLLWNSHKEERLLNVIDIQSGLVSDDSFYAGDVWDGCAVAIVDNLLVIAHDVTIEIQRYIGKGSFQQVWERNHEFCLAVTDIAFSDREVAVVGSDRNRVFNHLLVQPVGSQLYEDEVEGKLLHYACEGAVYVVSFVGSAMVAISEQLLDGPNRVRVLAFDTSNKQATLSTIFLASCSAIAFSNTDAAPRNDAQHFYSYLGRCFHSDIETGPRCDLPIPVGFMAASACAKWLAVASGSRKTSAAETSVIQSVEHHEPAAVRDVGLLQLQADNEFALLTEQRIHGLCDNRTSGEDFAAAAGDALAATAEKVHLLRFGGGDGDRLRQALLDGPEFGPYREEMDRVNFPYVLPSKALIFVKAEQYADVCRDLHGRELHPFHVVITESLEYLLDEVLQNMPSRKRPREKPGTRLMVGMDPEQEEETELEIFTLCEARTFICVAPRLKEPHTVAQSTTEAVNSSAELSHYAHHRGINPRRYA